jgi:hypothetical protein
MKAKTMRRIYLREATIILAVVRLAVRFLPAAQVFAWASRPPQRVNRFAVDDIGWVCWSIEVVGANRWMKAHSLARSLAAQIMLRRRGIVSRLCLGVAKDGETLTTHTWLEVGRDVIVGGADVHRFTRLAEFGGELA